MDYLTLGIWKGATLGKRKRIKEYVCRIRQPLKKDLSIRIEYIGIDYEEGYILYTTTCGKPEDTI